MPKISILDHIDMMADTINNYGGKPSRIVVSPVIYQEMRKEIAERATIPDANKKLVYSDIYEYRGLPLEVNCTLGAGVYYLL